MKPARPTRAARAEDLVGLVVDLEARTFARLGLSLPKRPGWFRGPVELLLNLFGRAAGAVVDRLGAERFWGLHHRALLILAGKTDAPIDARWDAAVADARRIFAELERQTGRTPGVLAALSHPPVVDNVSPLNFVVMRKAYDAVAAVRGRPTAVRELVAIDQLALDAAPWWQEGAYAGAMDRMHLAIDRQPSLRGAGQGCLLGKSRPQRLPFRISRLLGEGGDLAMILSGGVESTGRTLYTLREFVARLKRESSRLPEGGGAHAWRGIELSLARILMGLDDVDALEQSLGASPTSVTAPPPAAVETGRLPARARSMMEGAAGSSGVTKERFAALWVEFEAEFKRLTPYRARLFAFLFRRVVARGRPLLLLPIDHGEHDKSVMRLGRPVGLVPSKGGVEVLSVENGRLSAEAVSPAVFAARWVSENFS